MGDFRLIVGRFGVRQSFLLPFTLGFFGFCKGEPSLVALFRFILELDCCLALVVVFWGDGFDMDLVATLRGVVTSTKSILSNAECLFIGGEGFKNSEIKLVNMLL